MGATDQEGTNLVKGLESNNTCRELNGRKVAHVQRGKPGPKQGIVSPVLVRIHRVQQAEGLQVPNCWGDLWSPKTQ